MPSVILDRAVKRRSTGDGRQIVMAGLLVLLGLGIVAHPLYLWPHYGQLAYTLDVRQVDEGQVSSIEYAALPPDAQAAFDQAMGEEQAVLWSGEDDHAIEYYRDRPVIQHQGEYYRATLIHGHSGDFIQPILRWILSAAGVFFVIFGGLVLSTATWRPFTPVRALVMPVALTLAFVGTNAYDVLFSGVQRAVLSFPFEIVRLIPVTTLGFAVGSAVAAGRDSRIVGGGLVGIALLGALVAGNPDPGSLLVLAGVLAIGSAPWVAIGYVLTPRLDRSSQ